MLQAQQGDNQLTKAPQDMEGAFSYNSHIKCKGMSKNEAMQRYVELLPKLANDPQLQGGEEGGGGYGEEGGGGNGSE